jgi:hypothetical protein
MTTIRITSPHGRETTADLASMLTPDLREQTRVEANAWIKRLRHVDYGGVPMRERFLFRGDSLWWFTELYLHKMRRVDAAVSVILALESVCDREGVVRLDVESTDDAARAAATAFAAARGIPIGIVGQGAKRSGLGWPSYQIELSAQLSRLRGPSVRVGTRPKVAAFVHTAFWRDVPGADGPQQESYIGGVLDAIGARAGDGGLFCVGVGPRRNFRARRWWHPLTGQTTHSRLVTPIERLAPRAALGESLSLWRKRHDMARDLTSGDGIRSAAFYRGCDLWDVLRPELEGVAMLQWPWSARAMDEAGAALDALTPSVVLTYAEAGGWGRALMLEARRRQVPSVGVQHGFIYRHWLNYRHEADEMQPAGTDGGCPIPDLTLVFDRYAETHLREAGAFPAASLAVTGNFRLDQLVAHCNELRPMRDALRREFTLTPDQPLVVLAAKFSEIKDVLPELAEAVRQLPGMRLVIKPHPAETPDVYGSIVSGIANVSVAGMDTDLGRLLTAADALVTMNSTVAIDALALRLPSLVVGLPNNLSPFVQAGAMVGADGADAIRRALESLLYDSEVRQRVLAAGSAFADRFALASDGRAAARSADAILGLAGSRAGVA